MYSRASLPLGQSVSGSDAGGAARLRRSSQRAPRLMGFVHVGTSPSPMTWRAQSLLGAWHSFPHTGTPEAAVWAPSDALASLLSEGSQGVKCSSSPAAALRGLCASTGRSAAERQSVPVPRTDPGVLCAFLPCVGEAFSVLSWTSLLSDTSPLWASVCVGRRVWASGGGQQPAANGTYCCIIAGARLSGSLPAV